MTTSIDLARDFYNKEPGNELVELRANIQNPFSFEHAYPESRLEQLVPGGADRAREAGLVDANGNVNGLDMVRVVHEAFIDEHPELKTAEPRKVFEAAFAATGKRLLASGYDSTFQMHQDSKGNWHPEWAGLKERVGPAGERMGVADVMARIEPKPEAIPFPHSESTIPRVSAEGKTFTAEESAALAKKQEQRRKKAETLDKNRQNVRGQYARRMAGEGEFANETKQAEQDALTEGAWDRLAEHLMSQDESSGPDKVDALYALHMASQQRSGLSRDEYAARILHPESFDLSKEEAARLGPGTVASPPERAPAAPEAEAAAVHRTPAQQAAADVLGPPARGKEKAWAGKFVSRKEFGYTVEEGVAYAEWTGDPTAPDDKTFLDLEVKVPKVLSGAKEAQAIKAAFAKKLAASLDGRQSTGTGGAAAIGRFTPSQGATSAEATHIGGTTGETSGKPGASGRFRLAMPELVELAQHLMEGRLPEVKRALGNALGRMRGLRIQLRGDLFKNTDEAAATLSHEIGHVVDYIPDRTLSRGNIIGRIKALKKFMQPTLGDLKNSVLRKELVEVSDAWRPGLKEAKGAFRRYRMSGKELYADAFSMLLNDPDRLQRMAPTFFRGVMENLGAKPEFKAIYDEITARAGQGEEALVEHRDERVNEMLSEGAAIQARQLLHEPEPVTFRGVVADVSRSLLDSAEAIYSLRNQTERGSVQRELGDRAVNAIEEMKTGDSAATALVEEFFNRVVKPLDKVGATERDAGALLFYERIIKERSDIANPLGITAKEAAELREKLRARLGAERFDAVQKAIQDWRQNVRKPLIDALEKSGALSPELIEKIKSNDAYARFEVMKYAEDKGVAQASGLSALRSQVGTLDKIGNPLIATLLLDTSLQRLVDRTNAAKAVHDFADSIRVTEKPEMRFNGRRRVPKEPADPDKALLTYMKDGKVEAVVVPRALHDMFERTPQTARMAARIWDKVVMTPLRTVLITHNPGFAIWNLRKDIARSVRNTPGWSVGKRFGIYMKAIRDVTKAEFREELLPEELQMLRERALIAPGGKVWESAMHLEGEDLALDRIAQRYGVSDRMHRENVRKPLAKVLDRVIRAGQGVGRGLRFATDVTERAAKLGTYRYLKEAHPGISAQERAAIVRNRAGTPNVRRRGELTGLTNRIFMFSNVAKEGYRGSWEAFREDPYSYTAKTVVFDMLPALVSAGAARGLLGKKEKEWWDKVPEHDKANYTIIPLGVTKDGKAVYTRIPHDYEGQLWHSIAWKLATSKLKTEDLARVIVENFPWGPGGFNPIIDSSGYILTYAQGKNPIDTYHGSNILTDREMQAGGSRAWEKVLEASWNEVGSSLYQFDGATAPEAAGELEKLLGTPLLDPSSSAASRSPTTGSREPAGRISRRCGSRVHAPVWGGTMRSPKLSGPTGTSTRWPSEAD